MKLRADLKLRNIAGEYIIVDPGQDMVDLSKVFTLNESAVLVWEELLDKDFTVDTVVAILLANFEVEPELAREDAEKLLADFKSGGLIVE